MQAQTAIGETHTQSATNGNCDCPQPIPEERADQRGAAQTYCARCDRPVPVRWVSH